ncbi:MAG: Calx-beta domain-containing protein, partial [Planctomycetota bacterium]
LTFAPGETSKTISVTVLGDVRDEANETFFVNLSNAGNATVSDGQGTGTITDNDATPSLTISDVTVIEGDSGTIAATFTVSLSAVGGQTVSVDFATSNDTAVATNDFAATAGTLTFAPGETSKTITVEVLGDTLDEAAETFAVNLSNSVNASLVDGQGLGTITDNDSAPSLSIDDITVTEGNSGTKSASFTVTLSAVSGQAVTVNFATANQSAVASSDFTARTGSVTFAAGETTKLVTIQSAGDSFDEPDETFAVNLSNATNATLADTQGIAIISDDDPPPSLSINDVAITEGNAGQAMMTFTVSLSAASGKTISVDFATTDNTASAPSEYAANSGTLTFAPGETTKSVSIQIRGDVLDEDNETLFVNLTNASNATILDGQGLGTITDNDATPALTINDVTIVEGDSGSSTATFTVLLSAASGRAVTLNYATSNSTATAGGDFTSAYGTLTFAPGETSKTIAVQVLGDLLDELNETFVVNLSGATGAILADNRGIGTILDNDPTPTLSINDVTVTEGQPSAMFTVTLSAASSRAVTVRYFTVNGTAFQDFTQASGSLTFAPGETAKAVTIIVREDGLDEPDENFFVLLSTATNANIGDGNGTATIIDNDLAPSLSIRDLTVTEGNSGTKNATFTVSASAVSGQAVSVNVSTANSSAHAGSDFVNQSHSVNFAAGETTKTFAVEVIGDLLDEVNEAYFVNLAIASNATISDARGVGTIADNDPSPTVLINDVTITEGHSGITTATFTVMLSAPSGQLVSVRYATANSTAGSSDFNATSGSLSFAAGETLKTISVQVKGDLLVEGNEVFFVNLSSAINASILDSQGLGTIANDD